MLLLVELFTGLAAILFFLLLAAELVGSHLYQLLLGLVQVPVEKRDNC